MFHDKTQDSCFIAYVPIRHSTLTKHVDHSRLSYIINVRIGLSCCASRMTRLTHSRSLFVKPYRLATWFSISISNSCFLFVLLINVRTPIRNVIDVSPSSCTFLGYWDWKLSQDCRCNVRVRPPFVFATLFEMVCENYTRRQYSE